MCAISQTYTWWKGYTEGGSVPSLAGGLGRLQVHDLDFVDAVIFHFFHAPNSIVTLPVAMFGFMSRLSQTGKPCSIRGKLLITRLP